MMTWWLYGYNVLGYMLLPFAFVRLLWLSRKDANYRKRWGQRLGYVQDLSKASRETLWLHAVSLGETIAATRLIHSLCERYPDYTVVVSSMTPSGYQQAKKSFAQNDRVVCCHVPYDISGCVKRFLKNVKPALLIVMETEWWPNLWHQCAQQGIPLMVANGRLSQRSSMAYAKMSPMVRDMLQWVSCYAAQTEADAKRVVDRGLDASRVEVLGNLKFDISLDKTCIKQGKALRALLGKDRLVWIAAGTHKGEEDDVLAVHKKLLEQNASTALILVPRHPRRGDEIALLCRSYGLSVVRRTDSQQGYMSKVDVFLGDTLGEMMLFYAAADVAFVGGSLVEVGGHNLLEPAYLGLPVLTGPHVFNFVAVNTWLLSAEAAQCVQNAEQLMTWVQRLLSDQALCSVMGRRGQQVIQEHAGSVQRHVQCVGRLLKANQSASPDIRAS